MHTKISNSIENSSFKQILLSEANLQPSQKLPISLEMEVGQFQRLHFHISSETNSLPSLHIGITFGTEINGKLLKAKSTVWFEDTVWEREFAHTTAESYKESGVVLSIPVVAPVLLELYLHNQGDKELTQVYASVLGQRC